MKYFSLFVVICVTATLVQNAVAAASGPADASEPSDRETSRLPAPTLNPVRVVPSSYDFGIVGPTEDVQAKVRLHNSGMDSVTVAGVRGSCKCTKWDDLTGTVIPPGQSVDLNVTIERRTSPGQRSADVFIRFEELSAAVTANFHGEVSLPVRAKPSYILVTAPTRSSIRVESQDGKAFQILGGGGFPPVFLDGFDPDIDEPRASYRIEYDLNRYECEQMPEFWIIETDRQDCPLIDIQVRHKCAVSTPADRRRYLRIADRRVRAGIIPAGQSGTFEMTAREMAGDDIRLVRSLSDDFSVSLEETTTRDGEVDFIAKVTPRKGFVGLLYGKVRVLSKYRQADLVVIARVVE